MGLGAATTVLLGLAVATGCAPVLAPPGAAVATPRLDGAGLRAADGALLPGRVWMPIGNAPRAVVIALHGFNDYSAFFTAPAEFLAGVGIGAYAFDQRGFGEAPNRGLWAGTAAMVEDLRQVTALVRRRHPGVPVYLLGASMGGAVILVAMASADPPQADGVILSAPAVWGRATQPFYQRWALALAAHTVPWLKLTGRGLKIRASDNIEMLRGLGRDPLVIKETRVDAVHGLTDLMDAALDSAARLQARALILYGANDQVIRRRPTAAMLARLPEAPAGERRIAYYDKGFHMLLRDHQGETVWTDIAAWMIEPGAHLPSGADAGARAKVGAKD